MPTVFSSHTDFKEWFSNPLTGMVEGTQEYNDSIVKRLHQVCIMCVSQFVHVCSFVYILHCLCIMCVNSSRVITYFLFVGTKTISPAQIKNGC